MNGRCFLLYGVYHVNQMSPNQGQTQAIDPPDSDEPLILAKIGSFNTDGPPFDLQCCTVPLLELKEEPRKKKDDAVQFVLRLNGLIFRFVLSMGLGPFR